MSCRLRTSFLVLLSILRLYSMDSERERIDYIDSLRPVIKIKVYQDLQFYAY